MKLFFEWAYLLLVLGLFAGAIGMVWEPIKAWDAKTPEAAAEHNREVNWAKAYRRGVGFRLLAFPLGVIIIAMLAVHVFWSFSWTMYLILGVAWFLSAPLRRLWQFATIKVIRRKLVSHKLNANLPGSYGGSAWNAMRSYYERGRQKPQARPIPSKRKGLFINRLRWLNKVSWAWRWVRHLYVLWPIVAEGLASLIWPISATYMVFHHTEEALEAYIDLVPWWARS